MMEYLWVGVVATVAVFLYDCMSGIWGRTNRNAKAASAPRYMPGDFVERIDGTPYRVTAVRVEYSGTNPVRVSVKYMVQHHTGGTATVPDYLISRKLTRSEYRARTE